MGTIKVHNIPWDIGFSFKFYGEDLKSNGHKTVYIGHFQDDAPPGLEPNKTYCVKIINAEEKSLATPQEREFFDLVDFRGNHLRPILARNPAAKKCADELRRNGTCEKALGCIIVEPALQPCANLFKDCSKQPIALRLDAIRQISQGCEELTRQENRLGPYFIVAHRDLKVGNILKMTLNGKSHYYLIDFASIRLNKDDPVPIPTIPDIIPSDTYHAPMSPANTAPEDLEGSEYLVSGETDVYALGMMLAELFLTIENSTTNNPNARWCTNHGWNKDDGMQTLNKLTEAFRIAEEKYESNAAWDNTWIEQDLTADGYKMRWESMADHTILTEIRKLFFDSTRINPTKRISLPEFIERLKSIMIREEHSTSRIPLSLYLFDQTSLNQNRSLYQHAAKKVLEAEKEHYGSAASALCVAFRKVLPTDITWLDTVQEMGSGPLSSLNQLDAALQKCDTRNGHGQNTMLHALLFVTQKLLALMDKEDSPYIFTGQIHLFSPDVPSFSTIAPIKAPDGHNIDLTEFTSMMTRDIPNAKLQFFIYSPSAPDIYSSDYKWYRSHILLTEPKSSAYTEDSNDFPSPPHQGVPKPQSPITPASSADDDSFHKDYYIELDDGRRVYIGRK